MKLAVFASGSGSNFQALIDAIERGELNASIEVLVCDKVGAYALERAAKAGIETFVFSAKQYPSKVAFEQEILAELQRRGVELVILAGYMRLIGETLLGAYPNRIINLHPSLLPSFPGKDAIGQAVRAGVKVTGITIHFVDEGMDTGPIIEQKALEIASDETAEQVAARIHALEHTWYAKTIDRVIKGGF